MAIENELAEANGFLKRIAQALESLVDSQGIVPGESKPETKPAAKKASKKASKKKASKKASKKVGKTTAPATDLTIKDDVRPVLKRLRDEVNHAAVKSLLKKYSASTIQQLEPQNFQRIIDDAFAELGEDPDNDDDLDDVDEGQDELDLDDDDL